MHLFDLFINILTFLFIYLIIFSSISGYGIVFSSVINYSLKNIFDSYFIGLAIVTLFSFIIYLTFGFNDYFNILFLLLGVFFFIRKKNSSKYSSIFLILLFFLGIVISKSHDDFGVYHFQYVKEIYNSKNYIGIANLDFRYSYSTMLAYGQALFKLPFFDYKFVQIPVYLIYVSFIGYVFTSINLTKDKFFSYLKLVLIFLFILKFHRFSKHGYDFAAQFISLLIFFKIFENNNNLFKEKLLIIYFFIFLIFIKLNNIILFPLLLLLLNKENITSIIKNLKNNKILLLTILLMVVLFFVNNFIKSGCLFINIKSSCFNKEIISWSLSSGDFLINVNGRLFDYVELVEIWSKAFFTQVHLDKDSYLSFTDLAWVKYWFKNHFIYRISDFLLIFTLINIVLFLFFRKNFTFKVRKNYIILIPLSFAIISIWFLKIPEFRFGFSYILIFLFSIFISFFNFNVNINKKFLIKSFLFLVIFFNSINLLRIYDSLKSNAEYNFKDFPWYNLNENLDYNTVNLDGNYSFVIPNNKDDFCWNAPTPCSLYPNVKFSKKFIYTIISKSD
jgi:hypothetical protein